MDGWWMIRCMEAQNCPWGNPDFSFSPFNNIEVPVHFMLYCHGLPKVPDCQYAISKEWENWCHSKRNLLDYICLIGGFLRTVRCIVILSLSFFKVLEIYSIFEKGDYSKRWSSFLMQWLHPFRNLFGYLSSWDHSRPLQHYTLGNLGPLHLYRFNCRYHQRDRDCFRFREPLLLAVQHRTFGGGTFDPRSPV